MWKGKLLVSALLLWLAFAPLAQAFYNPSTGRWLSRDPLGERGGANLHGFVDNNPANRFDALGLQALPVPVPPGPPTNIIPFPTPTPVPRPIGPPQIAACVAVAIAGYELGQAIDESQDGLVSTFWGEGLADCAEAIKQKCKKPCPPCDPKVGTIGYRINRTPPRGNADLHDPCPGDHVHWLIRQQNPYNCRCFWANPKRKADRVTCLGDGENPTVPPDSVELPSVK